ncbi:DUF4249 family protein [Maribacter sp. 2307UL18-2]|uniref:DUF4249 family protein n=1 Tax=Maribacter sp. 2307UL18-2 TaxID=3386274 RepID=UPI0039BC388C
MNDLRKLLFCFLAGLIFSCEDVIEVDTPSSPPRLTIDALVRIDSSQPTTTISVKAGVTSSFFVEVEPTDLNQIFLINPDYVPTSPLDERSIPLTEVAPGVYEGTKNTTFFTEGELQLVIEHEGQRYLALTRYAPSARIDSIEQGDNSLFSENDKEIKISFSDDGAIDNFYLFDFGRGDYLVTEDEFYQGQSFNFSYFIEDGAGRKVDIALLGVDEPFYNYMNQLIVQAGGDQGPFQTPAATVRGNIINVTDIDNIDSFDNVENSDNFALGYFAVCETFESTIILEE